MIFGDDMDELLSDSLKVIERLAKAGFMLNLRKSHFGVTKIKVLGH